GTLWVAAPTFQMNCRGRRVVNDFPVGPSETKAPVEVLAVHEVVLIEKTDLLDSFTPREHESPIDRIHLAGFMLVQVCEIVSSQQPAPGKPLTQSGSAAESVP